MEEVAWKIFSSEPLFGVADLDYIRIEGNCEAVGLPGTHYEWMIAL